VVTEARLERLAVMEKAILVEGITDAAAVRTMARRAGRDLDAHGVAVVSLGGGGGLETHLRHLGPDGLGLELLGLCDVDHEARWARRLERAGLGSDLDREAMEALGFFVCDRDLEDELIKALGVDAVESLIAEQGDLHAFQTLTKQPYHRDGNRLDQLRRFLTSQSGRKRYIPLLVESLEPGAEPRPLRELLARA
jgi:Overcoming lysogenization defect protein-like, TOPRIM domain